MLTESLVPVIIEDLCFDINTFLGHKGHLVGIRTPNLRWETCVGKTVQKKTKIIKDPQITKIYPEFCTKCFCTCQEAIFVPLRWFVKSINLKSWIPRTELKGQLNSIAPIVLSMFRSNKSK